MSKKADVDKSDFFNNFLRSNVLYMFFPYFKCFLFFWVFFRIYTAECRLVIINSDTFINNPIIDTSFAPWSPNFTQVEGNIQYFPSTCNLNNVSSHTFTSSVKENKERNTPTFVSFSFNLVNGDDSHSNYILLPLEKFAYFLNSLKTLIKKSFYSFFVAISYYDLFETFMFFNMNCSNYSGKQNNLNLMKESVSASLLKTKNSGFPLISSSTLYDNIYDDENHRELAVSEFEYKSEKQVSNAEKGKLDNSTIYKSVSSENDMKMLSHIKTGLSNSSHKNIKFLSSTASSALSLPHMSSSSSISLSSSSISPFSSFISPSSSSTSPSSSSTSPSSSSISSPSVINSLLSFSLGNFIDKSVPREYYIWLFDTCANINDIFGIVDVANRKYAKALIFTDTNFTAYSSHFEEAKTLLFATFPLMPVLTIKNNLFTKELKAKLLNNEEVQVVVDQKPSMYFDCTKVVYRKEVSLVLIFVWLIMGVSWFLVTSVLRSHIAANPLHKFMLFPCILKIIFNLSSYAFWLMCPNYDSDLIQYLLMLYMGVNTVFNTIFYAIILLLSKGFMITTETFDRRNSVSIALTVSLVYIITSVNQVDPMGSLPALILLISFIFLTTLKSIQNNISFLQRRLVEIREAGIFGFENSFLVKLKIFKTFKILFLIFFFFQIIFYVLCYFMIDTADIFVSFQMILETLLYLGILIIFKPRQNILYFSLMQEQDSAMHILPMYSTASQSQALLTEPCVTASSRANQVVPCDSSSMSLSSSSNRVLSSVLSSSSKSVHNANEDTYGILEKLSISTPVVIMNPRDDDEEKNKEHDNCPYSHVAVGLLISPKKHQRNNCSALINNNKNDSSDEDVIEKVVDQNREIINERFFGNETLHMTEHSFEESNFNFYKKKEKKKKVADGKHSYNLCAFDEESYKEEEEQ